MLMMLAFLIDQTEQLCCGLFQGVLGKLKSKKSRPGRYYIVALSMKTQEKYLFWIPRRDKLKVVALNSFSPNLQETISEYQISACSSLP